MLILNVLLVGSTVVLFALIATYVYIDAPEYGMNPRKWAAVSFLIPFFGFFAYVFERDDRRLDAEDMFKDGGFEVHESRADDLGIDEGSAGIRDREDEQG